MSARTFTCTRCNKQEDASIQNEWGKRPDTIGYGPQPVCVGLIPHHSGNGSLQVCRGALSADPAPPA